MRLPAADACRTESRGTRNARIPENLKGETSRMKNHRSKIAASVLIPAVFIAVTGCEALLQRTEPVVIEQSSGSAEPGESAGQAAEQDSAQSEEAEAGQPRENAAASSGSAAPQPSAAQVYICGCVAAPGVYSLPAGARVNDALAAAGGFTEAADTAAVNLAAEVTDGQMIYIPSVSESSPHAGGVSSSANPAASASAAQVAINSATAEELMTLPGIGEAKAAAIVAYREANGPFTQLTDLMKVPGIKEGLYNQVKDRIRLN
jgi:competence protein ComEA